MNAQTKSFMLTGSAGQLQCALNIPFDQTPIGIALVAHPHPLYGGTMDNKVTQTLARTFVALGYAVARMNFRGVGLSEGVHDHGLGETKDMQVLLNHMQTLYPGLPVALAGFSFGAFVQARLRRIMAEENNPPQRLALVGSAAGKWNIELVPADTILIHGEEDTTIPLVDVLNWARPQDIPVIVIPGADHFFHRKLHHIKNLVMGLWDLGIRGQESGDR
jgi:alpha/beta superfamily hydrolase